jgi:hypothetical protein
MDDYDDEQPSVPTFSEGSIAGRRGANSRAAASRAFASKSAISIASKASAIIAASIQNTPATIIKQSNHIHNNQHRTAALNTHNFNPFVQAAIPNSIDIKFPKITNPIPLGQPQLPENPKSDIMSSINNFIEETTTDTSIKTEVHRNTLMEETLRLEEIYRRAIQSAHHRKLELLAMIQPLSLQEPEGSNPVKYNALTENISINQDPLGELIDNLRTSITLITKEDVLDHIEKYQISLRISIEEPIHKKAFEEALINKTAYLTSDA